VPFSSGICTQAVARPRSREREPQAETTAPGVTDSDRHWIERHRASRRAFVAHHLRDPAPDHGWAAPHRQRRDHQHGPRPLRPPGQRLAPPSAHRRQPTGGPYLAARSRRMEQSSCPHFQRGSLPSWTTGGSGYLTAAAGAPDQPGKRVARRHAAVDEARRRTRARPKRRRGSLLGPVFGGLALSLAFVGRVLDER
jgi:hypothetical protein